MKRYFLYEDTVQGGFCSGYTWKGIIFVLYVGDSEADAVKALNKDEPQS